VAWRTVMIQNQTKLNLHHKQLELHNESGVHSLPLEDITAIVLESPYITLTSALLAGCNEYGIAVITCDACLFYNIHVIAKPLRFSLGVAMRSKPESGSALCNAKSAIKQNA